MNDYIILRGENMEHDTGIIMYGHPVLYDDVEDRYGWRTDGTLKKFVTSRLDRIFEVTQDFEDFIPECKEWNNKVIRRTNIVIKNVVTTFVDEHPEHRHSTYIEQLEAYRTYEQSRIQQLHIDQEEQERIYEESMAKKHEEHRQQRVEEQRIIREEQQRIRHMEHKIDSYQRMLRNREIDQRRDEEARIKAWTDKILAQENIELYKINQYNDMIEEREQASIIAQAQHEEQVIQHAFEDQQVIAVYDKANDRTIYMTSLQYEDYIIHGNKYNIYETKPGQSFIGTGGESINKGMFGHDGGIVASTCLECNHIFYYTYRAPANRYRARCAHCEDWDKKYPYDNNYVRI